MQRYCHTCSPFSPSSHSLWQLSWHNREQRHKDGKSSATSNLRVYWLLCGRRGVGEIASGNRLYNFIQGELVLCAILFFTCWIASTSWIQTSKSISGGSCTNKWFHVLLATPASVNAVINNHSTCHSDFAAPPRTPCLEKTKYERFIFCKHP